MFLDTCFELILVRDAYTSIQVPVLVFFSKSVQGSAHFKIYSCGKNKTCLTSCLFCYQSVGLKVSLHVRQSIMSRNYGGFIYGGRRMLKNCCFECLLTISNSHSGQNQEIGRRHPHWYRESSTHGHEQVVWVCPIQLQFLCPSLRQCQNDAHFLVAKRRVYYIIQVYILRQPISKITCRVLGIQQWISHY